jgi:hypothetical protein
MAVMRLRRAVAGAVLASTVAVVAAMTACNSAPAGVDACKRIEQVRCESAQACGFDLETPPPIGSSPEEKVASCIRYYDTACLHGVGNGVEPATQAVNSCVNAIITGDCGIVRSPEQYPACSFLAPVTSAPDASDAAAATDAPYG